MLSTISARVPRSLKARARKYGIVISKVVRRALEAEVAMVEERRLREELCEVSQKLKGKISEQDLVKVVRETREER